MVTLMEEIVSLIEARIFDLWMQERSEEDPTIATRLRQRIDLLEDARWEWPARAARP